MVLYPLPWFPSVFIFKSWELGLCTALHNFPQRDPTWAKRWEKKSYRADPATVSRAASGVWCHYWSSLGGRGNSTPHLHTWVSTMAGKRGCGPLDCWCCKMGWIKRLFSEGLLLLFPFGISQGRGRGGEGVAASLLSLTWGRAGKFQEGLSCRDNQGLPPDSLTRKRSFLQELFLTV